MANPNTNPPIWLSLCHSDGVPAKWNTRPNPATQVEIDDYLQEMSADYFTGNPNFVDLPQGYMLFKEQRSDKNGVPINRWDSYIRGHPRGTFRSKKTFAVHVEAIWYNNLPNCTCTMCT